MTFPEATNWQPAISENVQLRSGTDVEIPAIWLLSALASYLAWASFAIFLWLGGLEPTATTTIGLGFLGIQLGLTLVLGFLGMIGLAVSAWSAHLVYTLLNRINAHSARAQLLLSNAIWQIEPFATRAGAQVTIPLSTAQESLTRLRSHHRDRSAILWGLLTVIPFLGWVFLVAALWLVSREFAAHRKWEALVVEDVDRTLRTAGLLGVSPADSRVGSHDLIGLSIILVSIAELFTSFFLGFSGSLVLIYLTVGAFSLGWIDLTIHEPRSHFRSHLQVEDAVARVLPNIAGVKGGVS